MAASAVLAGVLANLAGVLANDMRFQSLLFGCAPWAAGHAQQIAVTVHGRSMYERPRRQYSCTARSVANAGYGGSSSDFFELPSVRVR